MLRAIAASLLLLMPSTPSAAMPSAAAAAAVQLREAAEAHALRAVRLDDRLPVPDCPAGFAFRAAGPDAIDASCLETGWRMRLPLARAPSMEMPRRGEALRVEIEGAGYRATVDGIVESANAREASVLLRNPRSGTRFTARIQADGRVVGNLAPRL